jgi:hypothetical protein
MHHHPSSIVRQRVLAADDPGRVTREKRWWKPRAEWPAGLHFADGRTETVIDGELPARPVRVGDYGSTAGACADVG